MATYRVTQTFGDDPEKNACHEGVTEAALLVRWPQVEGFLPGLKEPGSSLSLQDVGNLMCLRFDVEDA